jgi:predicted nucleotidyltransferase component of viral defense system
MFSTANLKIATEAEKSYYQHKLYPLQDEILTLINSDRFYLSGGTCLSRYYYSHRYSDDLDFFYRGDQYPFEEFSPAAAEINNRIARKYVVEHGIDGDYFKRLFVHKDDVTLKLEFIHESYPHIGDITVADTFFIDSPQNIATNKITAIQGRKTVKDYIDLYFLLKDIALSDAITWAAKKVVPLDYEGAILTFSSAPLEGVVLMNKRVNLDEINAFGAELIKSLISHARKI